MKKMIIRIWPLLFAIAALFASGCVSNSSRPSLQSQQAIAEPVQSPIKRGMTVAELFTLKGKHFKVWSHAESGSAELIYDDISVWVTHWYDNQGEVVRVRPTTPRTKGSAKHLQYYDAKWKKKRYYGRHSR